MGVGKRIGAAGMACLLALPVLSAERLVSVYEAEIPAGTMEIVLVDDAQRGGVSGLAFDPRDSQLRRLEETPRQVGQTLLVNLMDGVVKRPGRYDPHLPASALEIRAYEPGKLYAPGRLISLRTRETHVLGMGRSAQLSRHGHSSSAAEVLQACIGCPFLYKAVLAKREDDSHEVTAIRVIDRIGRGIVQSIPTQDIVARDIDTLTFGDFNGDGALDFSMVPRVPTGNSWTGGRPHYYLFDGSDGQYRRSPELEELRATGYLEFPGDGRVLVKRHGRDPSPTVYRFTTPLVPVRQPVDGH